MYEQTRWPLNVTFNTFNLFLVVKLFYFFRIISIMVIVHDKMFIFFISLFFVNVIISFYNLSTNLELRLERSSLQLELVLLNAFCTKCSNEEKFPPIVFVTPTAYRPEQKADLTRLGQTLSSVCNLFWVIVEVFKTFFLFL